MIGMIREDLERTRQSLISDRNQREREIDKQEAEKIERCDSQIYIIDVKTMHTILECLFSSFDLVM